MGELSTSRIREEENSGTWAWLAALGFVLFLVLTGYKRWSLTDLLSLEDDPQEEVDEEDEP